MCCFNSFQYFYSVGFCVFGIWCDMTACGKDYKILRNDVNSVYINIFDSVIVALNVFFGILIGPWKIEHLFGILQSLTKVKSLLTQKYFEPNLT